ncbi:unnamed protein product, partial [Diplocarpon coronariae]
MKNPLARRPPTPDNTATQVNSMHLPPSPPAGRVPKLTLRTITMACLVAMGGFIFGYDTGQIS